MTANKALSDAECLEMCEHVAYEVRMLNYCALGIKGCKSPEQNLYIEGFALHLRNLLEFLYKPILTDSKYDDIRALHFVNHDTWACVQREKSPILQNAEKRAHKQLAHLTRSRQRREGWECTAILKALVPVLKLFVSHARQGIIDESLRSEVDNLEKTANVAGMAVSGTTTSTTIASTSFGFKPFITPEDK